MSNIQQQIHGLNRKILSLVETELNVLKDNHPSVTDDANGMYKRLRKNILDTIGDCERSTLENGEV